MAVLVAAETVVILVLVVLVAGLLRSHADIVRALHELGVTLPSAGDAHRHDHDAPSAPTRTGRAPGLSGATPSGDAAVIDPAAGAGTLLAFLSSGCLSCRDIWADLAADAVEAPGGARVVVVTQGPEAESESRVAELAEGVSATVVMSSPAWDDYAVPGAPYFVLVAPDGSVQGEGTAARWSQVIDLAERSGADAEREARNDRELIAAGIGPGDPRLDFEPSDEDPATG